MKAYRIPALLIMRELTEICEENPNLLIKPGYIVKSDLLNRVPDELKRRYFLGLRDLIDLGFVSTTLTGEHHLVTL